MCLVLYGCLVFASVEVAYGLRGVEPGVGVDAPVLVLVECRVEVEGCRCSPVAVDVDGCGDASARHFVVFRAVCCAVVRGMELEVDGKGALTLDDGLAVVEVDVLREAWLESGVTDAYVEGVGVGECVGNHVDDVRPSGIGVVSELYLFLSAELVLEVDDGRCVDDGASQQRVDAPFLVIHLADLRLYVCTDGQAVFRAVHAELEPHAVVLSDVLGVAALLLVRHGILVVVEEVVVIDVDAEHVVPRVEDGAHVAVVVAEGVAIAVVELQIRLVCDGFAVAQSGVEVVAVVRASVVLHFVIDGVAAAECLQEVVVGLRVAVAVVVRVAVSASDAERDVPSGFLQAFVDLQGCRCVDVVRVVPVVAQPVVHADAFGQVAIVSQRGGGVLEGVVFPGCGLAAACAPALAVAELGAEEDVPRRVGLPLYLVLEVEVAVAVRAMVPAGGVG